MKGVMTMYLKTKTVKRGYSRTSKKGKKHTFKTKARIVYFECDECGQEFTRPFASISTLRCCNDYTHYCESCYSPKTVGSLSDKIKGASSRSQKAKARHAERIGQRTLRSAGKGKGKYAWIYVGDTHPYSQPYCGSMLEHTVVMENHLGRTLKKGKKGGGEVVHHIDGDKLNNDVENLDVMTVEEHNKCHGAGANELLFQLYKEGIIIYNRETKRYKRSN